MKKNKSQITNNRQCQNNKFQAQNFYPLTLTRPVEELRCGARTLADHPERKISYIWELIVKLKQDLEDDLEIMGAKIKGEVHPTAVLLGKENILIEKGAAIEPYAVLDARSGPIYIGAGTIVKPQSVLRGPLSIGPDCRIAGEVVNSIFHGHSNKAHYGFIGHSYIGEWVNLGAGTTNSNLKNNYGTVKVNLNGKELDTGEQFMGCFIGDYTKLGIGTLITTGAVIGAGANVFGGGVTPKVIASFSWGEKEVYRWEKLKAAIKATMRRRNKILTAAAEKRLKAVYQQVSSAQ